MERKIWVRTMGSRLFPGLFTILVGPPGSGKGQAIHPAESILREIPLVNIGPSDLTAASLIDALNEATRNVTIPGPEPLLMFNSLIIISRELGVLIPSWEQAFMNSLTDIYDGYTVEQKRRGKDIKIKIPNPQINLLGACTPGYLNDTMPAGAWDQGFISRTLLIYSGERLIKDPFTEDEVAPLVSRLRSDLLHDLKNIAADNGQMSFTTPATAAIKAWIGNGCKPEPEHLRLRSYTARRISHLLKLCMIASISHSNDKIISVEHYAEALNWLIEAERYMPDIFKSMMSGGDAATMEEAWNYIWKLYSKEGRPIAEFRLVHFLRERIPAHSITRVIEIMVKSRMFETSVGDKGFAHYKPVPREARLDTIE